jgi:hypothetical protein
VKRVRSSTARFRLVFGSTNGYGVPKNWASLGCVGLGSFRVGSVRLG